MAGQVILQTLTILLICSVSLNQGEKNALPDGVDLGNILQMVNSLGGINKVHSKLQHLAKDDDQKHLLSVLEALSKVATLSQANKAGLASDPIVEQVQGTTDSSDIPPNELEDDLVPIILGSVLAGLVLIVLLIYLILRFK
eukprot:maker-scaffold60_size442463-snap-gene-0.22 protein:Tk12064 transcript:maker-scaffold60_size442463-snap-gene-0.22-mRNA-1 annotation:"cbn-lmp-2 protein"